MKLSGAIRTAGLGLAALLGGCWSHAFPLQTGFVVPAGTSLAAARRAEVFVDPNGAFYPNGWQDYVPQGRRWKADSLYNQAVRTPALWKAMADAEADQLEQLAKFASARQRIFILVHGYNNTATEALEPFDAIEARLDLHDGDGVLRFHWDGLTASGLGAGKIWFNAVGNSQLAGTRGLRAILNRIRGKQVYLIGHSRAASVILGALGDPPYDPKFVADTLRVAEAWQGDYARTLFAPPPLAENGNRIHVLLAAPAVDEVDFCDPASVTPGKHERVCGRLRPQPAQLVSLRYTVNGRDPVLNKIVGLGRWFNGTRLGLRPEVGAGIRRRGGYRGMCAYVFGAPQRFHSFNLYIRHSAFEAMLADENILKPGVPVKTAPLTDTAKVPVADCG